MLLPDNTVDNDNDDDIDYTVVDNYLKSYETSPVSEGEGGSGAEQDRGGNTHLALPGILLLGTRKLLIVRIFFYTKK